MFTSRIGLSSRVRVHNSFGLDWLHTDGINPMDSTSTRMRPRKKPKGIRFNLDGLEVFFPYRCVWGGWALCTGRTMRFAREKHRSLVPCH